nr:extensin-like [Lolium perenne]
MEASPAVAAGKSGPAMAAGRRVDAYKRWLLGTMEVSAAGWSLTIQSPCFLRGPHHPQTPTPHEISPHFPHFLLSHRALGRLPPSGRRPSTQRPASRRRRPAPPRPSLPPADAGQPRRVPPSLPPTPASPAASLPPVGAAPRPPSLQKAAARTSTPTTRRRLLPPHQQQAPPRFLIPAVGMTSWRSSGQKFHTPAPSRAMETNLLHEVDQARGPLPQGRRRSSLDSPELPHRSCQGRVSTSPLTLQDEESLVVN